MSELDALKYRAFISYSHADTAFAKWLHRGLEAFHIDKDLVGRMTATGPIPQALRPIFRDRDEFTAGHALAEQTLAALDDSHALIVVCSPASVKSRYVNEEIRLFKSRHPKRPVIPLIVDGKPDDPERECFPPALKFKLDAEGQVADQKVELLAADAREDGDGKTLALAKVIAGMLGVPSDEIFRRADRERRAAARRKRRVQIVLGALVLLLALAGLGWRYQDYLSEQYQWYVVMGPSVLPVERELGLKPGDEFTDCSRGCPRMVVVPAARFAMGSPKNEGQDWEHPQHEVTISKAFAVGKFEITFEEWNACVAAGACYDPLHVDWTRGKGRPASEINWSDAKQYAAWLSKLSGKVYRLPTEAEWEYVARAETTTPFFFGISVGPLGDYAWTADNAKTSQPVGQKNPNPFGLYDIYGNVAEWVEDCLHMSYDGAPIDGSAWDEGCPGNMRVARGGAFLLPPYAAASASREQSTYDSRLSWYGLRIARELAAQTPQ